MSSRHCRRRWPRLGVDARLVLPGFTALARRVAADRGRPAAHAVCHRAGADRAGRVAGRAVFAPISSITPPFTTGRAAPMPIRTGGTGPTIIAALRCSAGPPRRWRKAPTRIGGPTSCMPMIGMPGSRRPICGARRAARAERLHGAQPRLSGLLSRRPFSPICALPPEFFSIDGVEFYGGISFLKAGLFYADRLTTVSPTYAREIQTPAFGMGLDGLLRSRADVLTGILNGVDPEDLVAGKRCAVAATLRHRRRGSRQGGGQSRRCSAASGLAVEPEALLFGAVTRLTPQKGLDLLLAALPALIARRRPAGIARQRRRRSRSRFRRGGCRPSRAGSGSSLGYDEALSHLIMAGGRQRPRAVALRAVRADPALCAALWRLAVGAAHRRARRHGCRRQCCDLGRRQRDRFCL